MNRFQMIHHRYWPNLSPQEANDQLNKFEDKVFNKLAWLLEDCTEQQQDEVIEYCLELANVHTDTH